ncbi:small conductance calcium-activated potassium channel protein-like, partial [Condylostylus longicornis]|uniref:small conductance calcium-activated potassium channel protein-like n=1 Tax=Condylostylus longicornis TaxID=2530218 RepID=UPI00244E053F
IRCNQIKLIFVRRYTLISYLFFLRLRKVKMDQRKLMDNANTITDMAKTQNTVYEIISDMSTRQDGIDERLSSLEDKLQALTENFESMPDIIMRCLTQHHERIENRKNFLHPDAAVLSSIQSFQTTSANPTFFSHSRSTTSYPLSYQCPTNMPAAPGRNLQLVSESMNINNANNQSTFPTKFNS